MSKLNSWILRFFEVSKPQVKYFTFVLCGTKFDLSSFALLRSAISLQASACTIPFALEMCLCSSCKCMYRQRKSCVINDPQESHILCKVRGQKRKWEKLQGHRFMFNSWTKVLLIDLSKKKYFSLYSSGVSIPGGIPSKDRKQKSYLTNVSSIHSNAEFLFPLHYISTGAN